MRVFKVDLSFHKELTLLLSQATVTRTLTVLSLWNKEWQLMNISVSRLVVLSHFALCCAYG